MSEKKTRSGKITKSQKVKLLEVMKANKKVAMGIFSGPNSASMSHNLWEAIALELNAAGGAFKTADQWKKSWSDWKCSVKKHEAQIKKFSNRTGNLPASEGPIPLEGIDVEVLEFIPSDAVDGDGRTEEAGFPEVIKTQNLQTNEPEFLDLTIEMPNPNATPKATTKLSTSSTPSRLTPRGCNTFGGAYAEIKRYMEEQDKRQREYNTEQQKINSEILNMLKAIHKTLESIDSSLKPQSLNN